MHFSPATRLIRIILLSLLCICIDATVSLARQSSPPEPLPKLRVLTDEYAPFTYTQHDTVIGLATEVVVHMLDAAQLKYSLRSYPWARALNAAKISPNTLLFVTAKTPERKDYFTWIGPIAPQQVSIFRVKGNKTPFRSLDDVKQCTLGLARGYVSEEYLRSKGFREGMHYELSNTVEQTVKKLVHGRVDAISTNEFAITHYVNTLQLFDVQIEKALPLFQDEGYYLALNKSTDPRVVSLLRETFSRMQRDGIISGIVERYRR